MLKGVSVARRKRVKPAEVTTSRMRALARLRAEAQAHFLRAGTGRAQQRGEGVVDAADGIEIVLELIVGEGLDDHPGAVLGQRLADVRGCSDRVAHIVETIEYGDEIVVLCREIPWLWRRQR